MIEHDSVHALERHICPGCGHTHTHKAAWDWTKFWIGKLGNKFLAWVVYMVLQFVALLTDAVPHDHIDLLLILSGAVTIIFMLAGAIDVAVSKAEIKASANIGGKS